MTLYLCLHRLPKTTVERVARLDLQHQPYVDFLPISEGLRTPLYFTPAERELLRGTNLYGAMQEREDDWKAEWREVTSWVSDEEVRKELTWERWLWGCTILSSRAFSSDLIDGDKDNSTPVLFPGVDLLNHRPDARVTWFRDLDAGIERADGVAAEKGSLTIVLDEEIPAGAQVYNTYGAKANEELLLGYGFVLPSNRADFLTLRLSMPPDASPTLFSLWERLRLSDTRHYVPRSGVLPDELLAQMRLLLAQPVEIEEIEERVQSGAEGWSEVLGFVGWENELDVLDMLGTMLDSKAEALTAGPVDVTGEEIRPEVMEMVDIYRQGQVEVIQAAIEYHERLFDETRRKAEEAGVPFDEDDLEDLEEDDEEQ
ncbi:lysine methyltransferase [Rhodotorula toruloides]|uniref:Lysine methyltransferase n=1 Tax=Rhodotorula toruloides TaxID=5286 RepID=A0A511K8F2_RHOTO|nr:lysine methyltransferase [Rhodotorula toruloides]